MWETWVQSLGWEDPWRRKWQSTPVFLPEGPNGQRSLAGYSPWGRKRIRHNWATKQQFRNSQSASGVTQEILPVVWSSSHPYGSPNSSAPCSHSGGHTEPSLPLNWSGPLNLLFPHLSGQSLQHPHGLQINSCQYLRRYLTTVLDLISSLIRSQCPFFYLSIQHFQSFDLITSKAGCSWPRDLKSQPPLIPPTLSPSTILLNTQHYSKLFHNFLLLFFRSVPLILLIGTICSSKFLVFVCIILLFFRILS